MSASQVSRVFQYLPAGTATVWVMCTPYWNGRVCDSGLEIGLGVITGVLGLICWVRASISLYKGRCSRRSCNRGSLWALLAILEAGSVTALFAGVALLTPPGSTCFFLDKETMTSEIPIEVTYNILGAAALLSFAAPRLLGWLMSLCELVGIKVRPDPKQQQCAVAPDGLQVAGHNALYNTSDSPASAGYKGPMVMAAHPPLPSGMAGGEEEVASSGAAKHRGLLRWLFSNDRLELYMWQLLPAGTVILYQIVTAYYGPHKSRVIIPEASSSNDVGSASSAYSCSDSETAWLIVFIAVVATVSFFVTLESYERDCLENCPNPQLMFRTRGPAYKLGALVASVLTSGTFVAVALLTPPGALCFFPSKYQDHSLQKIGTIVLPSIAAAALLLALLRAAGHSLRGRRGNGITQGNVRLADSEAVVPLGSMEDHGGGREDGMVASGRAVGGATAVTAVGGASPATSQRRPQFMSVV